MNPSRVADRRRWRCATAWSRSTSRRSRRCRRVRRRGPAGCGPSARRPGASGWIVPASGCRRRGRCRAAPDRNAPRAAEKDAGRNWRARRRRRGTRCAARGTSRICWLFSGSLGRLGAGEMAHQQSDAVVRPACCARTTATAFLGRDARAGSCRYRHAAPRRRANRGGCTNASHSASSARPLMTGRTSASAKAAAVSGAMPLST